jgi:AcrR family transcriptional regulator
MTSNERKRSEGVDTRSLILDATEQLMLEQGYAGVSSRKAAEKAGLKSQLLHYYFSSMDDLFVATFERLEDKYNERLARAMSSENSLRALWALNVDAASAKLILEFTALASHRPALREIIRRSARRNRKLMVGAIAGIFERRGIDAEQFPPKVIALLMAAAARTLSNERTLQLLDGHAETLAFIEQQLSRFEAVEPPKARSVARRKRSPVRTEAHTAAPSAARAAK